MEATPARRRVKPVPKAEEHRDGSQQEEGDDEVLADVL
jgi:hypothetical protein